MTIKTMAHQQDQIQTHQKIQINQILIQILIPILTQKKTNQLTKLFGLKLPKVVW
ncbi:hypothetical protein [Companilactobacillus versmoldensis]|uniref:hypothetical protein n=1 Tax=Companilactobacillus versmoldensis TaxID=194326 RepID=UPI0012DF8431|nr:hypothetical protein [Companilactobacillus versmoldensis]